MNNCEKCICTRVCGLKDKYKQYIKEMNELNAKWGDEIFRSNPNCPEFISKDGYSNKKIEKNS